MCEKTVKIQLAPMHAAGVCCQSRFPFNLKAIDQKDLRWDAFLAAHHNAGFSWSIGLLFAQLKALADSWPLKK